MEEIPIPSMARTSKIIRKSIYTFLKHYQYFTSIATFIALPFSISVLISQSFTPRSFSLLPKIYTRLHVLFEAAGFPRSSGLFSLISLKLSQTISSSISTLPFAISFLLLAKASVIHSLRKNPSLSFISLYTPLLSTHLCNSFIIFSANATCFSLLFLAFNLLEGFQITSPKWVLLLSAIAAVFYSIVLANALVICNLALVGSGMEGGGRRGFMAVLRACVMIRGKTAIALGLALPINLGLAGVEALFHFRIISSQNHDHRQLWMVAVEGVFIAYLYSILMVLDVIMSCFFYQSCKKKNDFSLLYQRDYEYYEDNVKKLKGLDESDSNEVTFC